MEDTQNSTDPTPPSTYVDKIIADLKTAKEKHLASVDVLDHSIFILEVGKEYWDHVDPINFNSSSTGTASSHFLSNMAQEALFIRDAAENNYGRISLFSASSDSFGTVTATAHSLVCPVSIFNPEKIYEAINKPDKDEKYAAKFEAFDIELGKLYRQILEVRSRTTSHPEKSTLSDIRQTYDHLMRILAPDDEVRAQEEWKSVDHEKPMLVTRQQRLEYAAKVHVKEETLRTTILASTKHILAVYEDLNHLYHTERPLDNEKAYATFQAMLEVLNQWADAIGL